MKRWHLTPSERDEIRKLNRSGKTQREISKMLGLSKQTVAANLKRMKLPTRQRPPEAQILIRLRAGWSGAKCAAFFGVCDATISKIARKNKFRYLPRNILRGDVIRFVENILAGERVATAIRKANISPRWVGYRLGNILRPKLRSKNPAMARLVSQIENECFDGRFPTGTTPTIILSAVMKVFPHLSVATPEEKREFSRELLAAARVRLSQRTAAGWIH